MFVYISSCSIFIFPQTSESKWYLLQIFVKNMYVVWREVCCSQAHRVKSVCPASLMETYLASRIPVSAKICLPLTVNIIYWLF
jgi:hypothetical protein